jgi:hypothetical protein
MRSWDEGAENPDPVRGRGRNARTWRAALVRGSLSRGAHGEPQPLCPFGNVCGWLTIEVSARSLRGRWRRSRPLTAACRHGNFRGNGSPADRFTDADLFTQSVCTLYARARRVGLRRRQGHEPCGTGRDDGCTLRRGRSGCGRCSGVGHARCSAGRGQRVPRFGGERLGCRGDGGSARSRVPERSERVHYGRWSGCSERRPVKRVRGGRRGGRRVGGGWCGHGLERQRW